MSNIVFTPASLIDLLSQIDELANYDIGITETLDDKIQLTIGDSTYLIDDAEATEVNVDDAVVEDVEDINVEAYENLDDSIEVAVGDEQIIESGIIKELAKTLLVGGLVRLGSKLLK